MWLTVLSQPYLCGCRCKQLRQPAGHRLVRECANILMLLMSKWCSNTDTPWRQLSKFVCFLFFFFAFGFTFNKVSKPKIKGGAAWMGSWSFSPHQSGSCLIVKARKHTKTLEKQVGVSHSVTAMLCSYQFFILPITTAPLLLSATVRVSRGRS